MVKILLINIRIYLNTNINKQTNFEYDGQKSKPYSRISLVSVSGKSHHGMHAIARFSAESVRLSNLVLPETRSFVRDSGESIGERDEREKRTGSVFSS